MKNFARYKFTDNTTELSAETFNAIFAELDNRLDYMEQYVARYDDLMGQLVALGLTRLNEAVIPLVEENQALFQDLTDSLAGLDFPLASSNNLSELSNKATARTNLGLGTAAVAAASDFLGSGSAVLAQASNLSDLPDKATARTNLGLGPAATMTPDTAATANSIAKRDASGDLTAHAFNGPLVGMVKDVVYPIVDGAAFEINPANGGIQTITLGASRTPKATNFVEGQVVTLMIDDGTARLITWTDSTLNPTWLVAGGSAPVLATTGYTVVILWKVGSVIYGRY